MIKFIFLSFIISTGSSYGTQIVPKTKTVEIFNTKLSAQLIKKRGYKVRQGLKVDSTLSPQQLNTLLEYIEMKKYTARLDSISKQIFLHRIFNYNITQLQFYYPYIKVEELVRAKNKTK